MDIKLDGGTLAVENAVATERTSFAFENGTLRFADPAGCVLGLGGIFYDAVGGDRVSLSAGQTMQADYGLYVMPNTELSAGEGRVVSDEIIVKRDGTLNLGPDGGIFMDQLSVKAGGTVNLGGGELPVRIRNDGEIIVTADSTIGSSSLANVYGGDGVLRLLDSSKTLNVLCASFFNLAGVHLNGGTVVAENGAALSAFGITQTSGAVQGRFAQMPGSILRVTGDLTIGDVDSPAGFFSDGELYVNDHTVTVNDRNEAVLGSLTTLGSDETPGTLEAANGLIVEFGKTVTGYGTLDTPNDSLHPLLNNGLIAGNSAEEPITLNGYIKGVGTLSNVILNGTISPGFSPAEVDLIDAVLGDTATVIMELGGAVPGNAYDVLNVSEHIDLAGTLDIDLINAYRPREGDAFDLFNFADFSGEFDAISLPTLQPGLVWDQSQLYTTGTLAVVPEPSTLTLAALGLLSLLAWGRRRKR